MHKNYSCWKCLDKKCNEFFVCYEPYDDFYVGDLTLMKWDMDELNQFAIEAWRNYIQYNELMRLITNDANNGHVEVAKEKIANVIYKTGYLTCYAMVRRDYYQELILQEHGIFHVCENHLKVGNFIF